MADDAKQNRYQIGGVERDSGGEDDGGDADDREDDSGSDSAGDTAIETDSDGDNQPDETARREDAQQMPSSPRFESPVHESDGQSDAGDESGRRSGSDDESESPTDSGGESGHRVDSGRDQIGFSTQFDELPHRVRTNSPSEGRSQIDMKVGPEEQQHLSRLEEVATREFDETVYLTDVKLAALVVGLRASDERFLDEMRQIGYGYLD